MKPASCSSYGCKRRQQWGLEVCIAYDCYRQRPGKLNEWGWRGVLNALIARLLGRQRSPG